MPKYTREHLRRNRQQLILDFCARSGKTTEDVSEHFEVNYHTAYRWLVELEKQSYLVRSPIPRNGRHVFITSSPDTEMPQVFFQTQSGDKPLSTFIERYVTDSPLLNLGHSFAGAVCHLYLLALRKQDENVDIAPTSTETRSALRDYVNHLRDHLNMMEIVLTTDVFYQGDKRTISAIGRLEDNLLLSDIVEVATAWEHSLLSKNASESVLDNEES